MRDREAGVPVPCMSRGDEARLIAKAKRGHADAFRALVDAYKERLFAFVWRMVRNHHEAEDVCQSAFVKAYESLASYSDEYAFSTWLFTIAYRMCLNTLRKKKAVSGDVDFARIGKVGADAPEALANSEEARRLRQVIWASVDRLSSPQKSAVLLFYREGKSCQDIGEILGMPAVTVEPLAPGPRKAARKPEHRAGGRLDGDRVHARLSLCVSVVMRCAEYERLLDAYLDGHLAGSLRLEFDAHRLRCRQCQQTLAMMEAIGHVLAAPPRAPALSEDFTDLVMGRIEKRRPLAERLRSTRVAVVAVTLLQAAAVILFAIMLPSSPTIAPPANTAGQPTIVDFPPMLAPLTALGSAGVDFTNDVDHLVKWPFNINVSDAVVRDSNDVARATLPELIIQAIMPAEQEPESVTATADHYSL
jgi:RNA polymerase sigma-70 factor, ECF subfamily